MEEPTTRGVSGLEEEPVQVIHSQTGLTIKRNPKNQFVICTLHFTADPKKRSAEWEKEARAGMSEAKFQREYNIDYGAMFGERVFPEAITHQDKIIVQPKDYPVFPTGQVYYGGFDYGMRNPSSFHVYTIWDGVVYAIWELYEPCKNIKDFVWKLKACPYWDSIRFIAADPSIAGLRHYNKDGNGASIRDQFSAEGVRKFLLSGKDEGAWLAMMRKHWSNPTDPTFRIYAECPNMIREFQTCVYASQREAALRVNFKEAVADVNNHALDDAKYFMLVLPRLYGQQQTGFKMPIMVNKWCK